MHNRCVRQATSYPTCWGAEQIGGCAVLALNMTNRSYYKVVAVVCQSIRLPIREPMLRLFGQKLQYLRRSKQLTQAQLAAQLGTVTQSYISHLEAGRKEPSIEFVLMVADLFHVSLDYLLRDTIPVDSSEHYST